jgi:hypothetical protein
MNVNKMTLQLSCGIILRRVYRARDPFARDVAFDPGRASAPRIAVPHILPSSE